MLCSLVLRFSNHSDDEKEIRLTSNHILISENSTIACFSDMIHDCKSYSGTPKEQMSRNLQILIIMGEDLLLPICKLKGIAMKSFYPLQADFHYT